MACTPCWQQRQLFANAWRQGNPFIMAQVMQRSIAIATDKMRGIDVNRKYGGNAFAANSRQPRSGDRVR